MNLGTSRFYSKARLAAEVLPYVTAEKSLALTGGTAINLIHQNCPRLSVDLDLVYVGDEKDDDKAIRDVRKCLLAARARVRGAAPGRYRAVMHPKAKPKITLSRRTDREWIKIEVSGIARQTIYPPEWCEPQPLASDLLGISRKVYCVSCEEAYAGKMCASLSRQYPRDLFDMLVLYETLGISDDMFKNFLVYVAGNKKPPAAVLTPAPLDRARGYVRSFKGMAERAVSLPRLYAVRDQLVADVRRRLTRPMLDMFLSMYDGAPDFSVIDRAGTERLPAVRQNVRYLRQLRQADPAKYARERRAIEALRKVV
ncbi:MAG: nucleotidyl transferase AbiEii/AbiGii toxin family protein [Bacteroidota bacterium]|nr:nucleotidyl transferase AbiEii/AbiGii toxin family protein [Bacteroidota bacterium]